MDPELTSVPVPALHGSGLNFGSRANFRSGFYIFFRSWSSIWVWGYIWFRFLHFPELELNLGLEPTSAPEPGLNFGSESGQPSLSKIDIELFSLSLNSVVFVLRISFKFFRICVLISGKGYKMGDRSRYGRFDHEWRTYYASAWLFQRRGCNPRNLARSVHRGRYLWFKSFALRASERRRRKYFYPGANRRSGPKSREEKIKKKKGNRNLDGHV